MPFVSLAKPGCQARPPNVPAEGEPVSPCDELNHSVLQLATWNIQGKPLELAVTALHGFQLDLQVVAFQEVGRAIASEEITTDGLTMLELGGLALLVAKPDGCFRHAALGLDADCFAAWGNGHVGHSHLCCAVSIPPFTKPLCIACVHLPHHGRPVDDFLAALASLELCLRPIARKGHPILVLGDLTHR